MAEQECARQTDLLVYANKNITAFLLLLEELLIMSVCVSVCLSVSLSVRPVSILGGNDDKSIWEEEEEAKVNENPIFIFVLPEREREREW